MADPIRGVTPCLVYGIRSADGVVHYVGQTTYPISEREIGHRTAATPYGTPIARFIWACDIVGIELEFYEISGTAVWDVTEMEEIAKHLDIGYPLQNSRVPKSYSRYVRAGEMLKVINDVKGQPFDRNATLDEAIFKCGMSAAKMVPFFAYLGVTYVHELYGLTTGQIRDVPGFGPGHTAGIEKILKSVEQDSYRDAYEEMMKQVSEYRKLRGLILPTMTELNAKQLHLAEQS